MPTGARDRLSGVWGQRSSMKRLTRVLLLIAVVVGFLWVAWQAVDEARWEDSTLWNITPPAGFSN